MNTGGLKRIHIVLIGVAVGILIAVGAFFALIQPDQAAMADVQSSIQGFQDTISKKPQYEKDLKTAQIQQATKKVALAKYETKYFRLGPERAFLSMKDPQKAMILLWKEQAQTIGPLVTQYIKKSGVRLLTPLTIPGAPVDPNQINPNEYDIPLGQIQVMGTFSQINNFVRSLGNAPRLIRVNNVELAGESPNLTGTLDLTVIILPRDSSDAKPIPIAGSDAGAGGAAGPYGPAAGPYGPTATAGPAEAPPGGANGAGGANGGVK